MHKYTYRSTHTFKLRTCVIPNTGLNLNTVTHINRTRAIIILERMRLI